MDGGVWIEIPNNIPESLQKEIVKTIWQVTQDATAQVREQIALAEAREAETVEGLCQAEQRVAELREKIEQKRGVYLESQQQVEIAKAILPEQLTSAKNNNHELMQANNDQAEKLNAAHIELAELRQAMKYAEGSLSKVKAKVEVMQQKMEDLTRVRKAFCVNVFSNKLAFCLQT